MICADNLIYFRVYAYLTRRIYIVFSRETSTYAPVTQLENGDFVSVFEALASIHLHQRCGKMLRTKYNDVSLSRAKKYSF